jgi:hypothetical protein
MLFVALGLLLEVMAPSMKEEVGIVRAHMLPGTMTKALESPSSVIIVVSFSIIYDFSLDHFTFFYDHGLMYLLWEDINNLFLTQSA